MKLTAAGTVPVFHRIPLLHDPDAKIANKTKKEEKPFDFSSVVAGGGLEPPASGL